MTKNTYIKSGFVGENPFRSSGDTPAEIPAFDSVKSRLPSPFWEGQEEVIRMYWRAWELGFNHLKRPSGENGFISSYLDTAYNGNIFLWDSVFITHFCRYGVRAFPFQKTLDNFYRKQHPDGFICREISGDTGEDAFQRHDPTSTGPNLLAWSEMEYYKAMGDKERLNAVFPGLCAYHLWLKENRTWQDGSYWTSGWGSGMDNIPRLPAGRHPGFSHGHMSWVDATLQQYFNGQLLLQMGFELERWQEIEEIETEMHDLGEFILRKLWDPEARFLLDRHREGTLGGCRHIGAFWALHLDLLEKEQIRAMIDQLRPGGSFDGKRSVPSLDVGHPQFRANGRYWQGGVWAPMTYAVLRGLQKQGEFDLAHTLGRQHCSQVLEVFRKTGTFWEYYSPEEDEPGFMARPDFVGWTGLVPISVLFEQVMGIRASYDSREIRWHLALPEPHGIAGYPFGPDHTVDLKYRGSTGSTDAPVLEIRCDEPLTLFTQWKGREQHHTVRPGKERISLEGPPENQEKKRSNNNKSKV